MKLLSRKKLILVAVLPVVWLLGAGSAFGQGPANGTRAARALALKEMLGSVEGIPREAPQIFKTKDGYLRFVGAPPSTHFPVDPNRRATPQEAAGAFLGEYRNLFVNVSPAVEFNTTRIKTRDSRSYVRYRQTYAGLEVFGAEVIVQVNAAGGIAAVMSDIMRDTQALDMGKVSLNPTIDALKAQGKAIEFLAAEHPPLEFEASDATLMIFDSPVVGRTGRTQLVWQNEVSNVGELLVKECVLVDAQSGEITFHYSLIYAYRYRKVYDYEGRSTDPYYLRRYEGQEEPYGVDDVDRAYDYLGDTYEFYDVNHGRDGYKDDPLEPEIARVRYTGDPHTAWFGYHMRIGPGWVTDDVVGHEFTHGVTQNESKLIYSGESGAISESFSDMWGEWIDQTYNHNNDEYEYNDDDDSDEVKWLQGEDSVQGAKRDMADPPQFRWWPEGEEREFVDPDRYNHPDFYEGDDDWGGVHHNSGVGNKLCYLLTDGNTFNEHTVWGMEIPKTADLFYECQTGMIPKACDYYDLYQVITHAAKTLEMTWEERVNIEEACQAVEIANDPLVHWWKFDYGSGTTAYDSVGDANGELVGGTAWVEDGKIDGALEFDGGNDYVSLAPIDALKGNTVTISAWIKARTLSGSYNRILQQYESPNGYCLYVYDDYKPKFYLNYNHYVKSPDVITVGKWYHIAGTYDGYDLRIYVDGVLKGTESEVDETGINHAALIGKFDGIIDDVRVYNWAVDVDEILDKMFYGTSKFSIKNKSGVRVAWFDDLGNLFLKGSLATEADLLEEDPDHDEFRVQDSEGDDVAIIDTTNGDMYIKESKHENHDMELHGQHRFIIKDSNGDRVAYINDLGDLYLKGKVYQQNP